MDKNLVALCLKLDGIYLGIFGWNDGHTVYGILTSARSNLLTNTS